MKRLPVRAVLRVDTAANSALFLLVVVWIAAVVAWALGRVPARPGDWLAFTRDDPYPALLTVVGTLGAVGVIAWRTVRLRRLLFLGAEVEAVVESADFHRGRGRVRLSYPWRGELVQTWVAIRDVRGARRLSRGEKVIARVDPDQPDVAMIPSVYVDRD